MAISRFARALAFQRNPVRYKTTESGSVEKTRRVSSAPVEVRMGTPEYDQAMAQFRKADPKVNGVMSLPLLQQMMTKAPVKGETPEAARLRQGFYDTPNATYQRKQVLMGGLDPRGGSNYRDAIYKSVTREEKYQDPFTRTIEKEYRPFRQRAQYATSRKRGGLGILAGGL